VSDLEVVVDLNELLLARHRVCYVEPHRPFIKSLPIV
jgi:hypothetical protein